MKNFMLIGIALMSIVVGCSSEEDVRKTQEPTYQRWTQPWENGGYDQNVDQDRPYYGGGR